MPKLYWRNKNEEQTSGDIVCPSRPSTQDSTEPSLWVDEDGVAGDMNGRSPAVGLLRIDTHKRSFDESLDTYRAPGPQLNNGLVSPTLHIKNNINGRVRQGTIHHRTTRDQLSRRSIFDAEPGVDIATMAAQREQLKGARNVRGMMAPIISKEEESRTRSANRKPQLPRHRSESTLDHHSSILREDMDYNNEESQNDMLGNLMGKRGGAKGMLGRLSGVAMRQHIDYLDMNGRTDIMAQSMRRQSLRGSKQSLIDGQENGHSKPEDSEIYTDGVEEGDSRRRNHPKFIPSSQDDIQILNLQGFMDSNMDTSLAGNRRKHKKKRVKRVSEPGMDRAREAYKFNAKPPRRKRNHRSSSDDDGEMVLKDVEDIDTRLAGMVLGPEKIRGKEPVGEPITLEEASALRSLLTGSPTQLLPPEWLAQNFKQNSNPNLSYGIVQKKGGPCGVLACVQAYMMKVLVFGSTVAPTPTPVSPLRPSQREWQLALSSALTEILWKSGEGKRVILATPGPFPSFTENGAGRWSRDGVTEHLILGEYCSAGLLQEAVMRLLPALTTETGAGCIILLYSLILTRGINNIHSDMDPGGGHLINAHGYSSQEVINLFLVGQAVTNTFDGEKTLASDTSNESMVLKGINNRSEIGMLSLFEHYDCYKVGIHLKSPQYPIWVVCCESHYSCLFSRDTTVTSDTPASRIFDVYYYDGLALQEDEIRLTIDLEGDETEASIVPPLEHCIRTKWKGAAVNWNGTDPIL